MKSGLYGCLVASIILSISALPLLAHDKGQYESPDVIYWMTGLRQPDNMASCCGVADAYYADETQECGPLESYSCALVAIITDDRDDIPLRRQHIPVGTRIIVPPNKIRKPASNNPSGHTIIFVAGNVNPMVYCYEPLPLM